MTKDRNIDVTVNDIGRIPTIEISESGFSFIIAMGDFQEALMEEDNVLLLQFAKGEIRIELSIDALLQKLNHS